MGGVRLAAVDHRDRHRDLRDLRRPRACPTKVVAQKGLTAFAVQGGPAARAAGVLVALLAPLAEAGISIFTVSTYETNWILVPLADAERAGEAWRRAGHTVVVAVPVKPVPEGQEMSVTTPRASAPRASPPA